MKTYSAKTLEEALAAAAQDLSLPVEEISYEVTDEKKGLFSKKVTIAVYELSDAIAYAEDYLIKGIENKGYSIGIRKGK